MFVRLAKVKDCQEIYDLIKDGDSGMTTLPKSKDEVSERIKKALNYIDRERLVIAPDCGLGFLTKQLAYEKLKVMCRAAELC